MDDKQTLAAEEGHGFRSDTEASNLVLQFILLTVR